MQATLNLASESSGSGRLNGLITREERYGWRPQSQRGRLEWLKKSVLHVDTGLYQRQRVNAGRVSEIAANFNWPSFMPLGVYRRGDGTFWVYDGQHRLEAVNRREDIEAVPCWVFDGTDVSEEAAAFVGANTVRGPVRALDRFRARLVAGDADAAAISVAVESIGYRLAEGACTNTISCVSAIEAVYARGADHLERVLTILSMLYKGKTFCADIVRGLSYVDLHLGKRHSCGIDRRDIVDKLIFIGSDVIEDEIRRCKGLSGKSGERVTAIAVVKLINKNKRGNKLEEISL
jgi:hypothetical protein